MEREILVMYPQIILYSLIFAGLFLLALRKKKKFKKGIIVANTKYVKRTSYFKILNAKYHLYNILIKITCIVLIFLLAVLSSRLYEVNKHDEEYNNRDIMLCMDFSGSVSNLNKDIIKTMEETVKTLKEERFGITIFDSSSINLVPLTSDYNFVLYTLELMGEYYGKNAEIDYSQCKGVTGIDALSKCINDVNRSRYNAQSKYLRTIFTSGISAMPGSSLIGDGVASCAKSFTTDDDRTKIIILTTDNATNGTQTITVSQAGAYAKKKGIKVYPIGTKSIKNDTKLKNGLINLASTTGGVYYDHEEYSTDEISKKIEELNKSAIIKTTYVTKKELPEIIVPYILWILPLLFLLDWRVRI